MVGWRFWPIYRLAQDILPSTAAEDYAAQDDSRVTLPEPQELTLQPYNRLKNVYWGELHVHTTESLDAVLFGTTATIEDAYRFARGEPLRSPGGELMQLSRPLDFVAITDHAEGFGLRTRCGEPDLSLIERANCRFMQTPGFTTAMFLLNRQTRMAVEPDPTHPAGVYRDRSRSPRRRDEGRLGLAGLRPAGGQPAARGPAPGGPGPLRLAAAPAGRQRSGRRAPGPPRRVHELRGAGTDNAAPCEACGSAYFR